MHCIETNNLVHRFSDGETMWNSINLQVGLPLGSCIT